MIPYIHGTGTHNQGAELMAAAIAQRVLRWPQTRALLVDQKFGPPQERRKYGLESFIDTPPLFKRAGLFYRGLNPFARQSFRLFTPEDVTLIFDASGFAYSDQWGPYASEALLERVQQASARNVKTILLPQALGPFTDKQVREPAAKALQECSLVYARDKQSLAHLHELAGERDTFKLAPDFTSLLAPLQDTRASEHRWDAAVVPNQRMVDKTGIGNLYTAELVRLLKHLCGKHRRVAIILHSRDDRALVEHLKDQAGPQAATITESDPLRLKGILRQCGLVIGSRFHALQSALCQGVPTIGIGWSHKYQEMFADYHCGHYLIPADEAGIRTLLTQTEQLIQPAETERIRKLLAERSRLLRGQSIAMWEEIENHLGVSHPEPSAET